MFTCKGSEEDIFDYVAYGLLDMAMCQFSWLRISPIETAAHLYVCRPVLLAALYLLSGLCRQQQQ
jgi:hypothetical protein